MKQSAKIGSVFARPKLDPEKVTVSVIIAARNEERFLPKCLESFVNQTFPPERMELIIIDSASTDATPKIIDEFKKRAPFTVKTLFNPDGDSPTSRNIGTKIAQGDLIFSMIAHGYIEPNHIHRCIEILGEKDADGVCGRIVNVEPDKKSSVEMGIASALGSPFGVGDAQSRVRNKAGWIDNPMLAIYRRELFDHFGLFDERLTRNLDYEFNQRCARGGAKFWFEPSIKINYFSRATYSALWKQFFDTAYWRAYMIDKHRGAIKLRHIIPSLFITSLISGIILAMSVPSLLFIPVFIILIYVSVAMAFSLSTKHSKLKTVPYTIWAFVVMHLSYGIGFLSGIIDFIVLRKKITKAMKQ